MRFSISTTSSILLIIFTICLLSAQTQPSPNQQAILDFDSDQETIQTKKSFSDQQTSPPPAAPTPTGLAANLIKKFTGWNDSLVAKITGQISPRPPHPFVVPITDDNYHSVIESDLDLIQTGWGSDDNTVWVVSVVATDKSSILFEDEFDKLASNSSLSTQPIPIKKREDEIDLIQKESNDPYLFKKEIRFARIDYMGKTDLILTKWLIFKCPVFVIITKRGNELRFFKTGTIPPSAEVLGDFLREERWLHKPVWNSTFSRGNSGEWIVNLMGRMFKFFHDVTDQVPGWVLMLISSMLGTSLMQWLHASGSKTTTSSKKTAVSKNHDQSETNSTHNPNQSDQLASDELKKDLAQAAARLANITDKKIGNNPSHSVQKRKK